ncbi:hypothetical protein [Streptomyces sp. NPDC060002]|uniref:hypothetical protein n=1 Tax=Streptomyces sp. NPDC060002 TaxID=3347033 RepID=UPI0036B7DB3F
MDDIDGTTASSALQHYGIVGTTASTGPEHDGPVRSAPTVFGAWEADAVRAC